MKRCLLFAFLAFSAMAAEPLTVTKDSVRTLHKGKEFARLTDQPRLVAPLTGLLCRPPGPEILDKEKALVGPHARTMVHYYANAIARDAMAQEAKEFPVGAVFVKEKLAPKEAVLDVGGMVKREKGYDPAHGDWEFFFSASDGKFDTGKLATCVDCHGGGKRDHVFAAWALGKK
jgi:hypothetical protein